MMKICDDCGEYTEMYEGIEIKEPKLCLICYAAMVGFYYNDNTKTFHVMDDELE